MTPDTPLGPTPPALAAAVAQFAARPRLVVASDFDGVLAPLVDDPMTSRPLPGTIAALDELSRLAGTTVALVSGRALATLTQLTGIAPASPILLFGSHGGEASLAGAGTALTPQQRATLDDLSAALDQIVTSHPPARLERKPMGVVLHTRGIDPVIAARAGAEAIAAGRACPGVETMRGKDVVELTVGRTDKGSAVLGLAASAGATAVLYFGDDVTDESVFTRLGPSDIGIKVGPGASAAAYRLAAPAEVGPVLELVLAERLRIGPRESP